MSPQTEIAQLLAEDEISTETAVRLILKSQHQMQDDIANIAAMMEEVKDYQDRYPSITWLFANKRKETTLVALAIFTLFYSLFSPITISDLRHSIFVAIGIPTP